MTDLAVAALPAIPLLAAVVLPLVRSPRRSDAVSAAFAAATATLACVLAVAVFADGEPLRGSWYVVDNGAAAFVCVIAVIGLLSALASPAHLSSSSRTFFRPRPSRRSYYAGFHVFWAVLLAIPLVDNLAVAWLLIEATTAASAILVASTGGRAALEAGWKYLVLTTLGLAVALLGIVILYAGLAGGGGDLATLDWSTMRVLAGALDPEAAVLGFVLVLVGLAAKIGWAPVHNWLPDAHSEAPPPVSALLSAALLPTVMFVAWRTQLALQPGVGSAASGAFLAFGLASLAAAIPFLWRSMPLKRLLAYSSLEHMGVLALGIGFATPLATAGVLLHVCGHALAKSLGFYAVIPLLRADATLSGRPARALSRTSPAGAAAVAVSLGALAGVPPSPLFFSEVVILAGGVAAGEIVVVAVAAGLLALGFLGLAHALIEGVVGERRAGPAPAARGERRLAALTVAVVGALLALSATAYGVPGSALVERFMDGVT